MNAQPTTTGTWNRTARKHYTHISGIVVRYSNNGWAWEIIGGKRDGLCFGTLSAAQSAAEWALTN